MRYPSDYLFPQQRVRTPEETKELERRVPTGDPSPKATWGTPSVYARYVPKKISLAQIARIRTALSAVLDPESTWTENGIAVHEIDSILEEVEK